MDEQKPPRRPRIAGDIERTSFARRRTPVEGAPQYVEPEVSASVLIAQHIDILDGRLSGLERTLQGYTSQVARQQETLDGMIVPSVKSLLAAADAAGRASERATMKLERSEELLVEISATLKDLVVRVGRLEGWHESLEERVEANEALAKTLVSRVTALELTGREAVVRVDERRKILTWGRAALLGAGGAIAAVAEQLLG